MTSRLLTRLRVGYITARAKLSYAGRAWREVRQAHHRKYGACAIVVQGSELIVCGALALALERLAILLL